MKLWEYMLQANYQPAGDPNFVLGTQDVQAWVNENKGEIVARDKTIIDQLVLALRDRRGIVRPRLQLHPRAQHAAVMGTGPEDFAREITSAAVATDGQADGHKLGMYRRGIHSAVAVGMNMSKSAYPVCKLYYVAKPLEAEEGLSWDFVNKHVSVSERSDRTAKHTAFRRMNPGGNHNGPPASSTIDSDGYHDLRREISERNAEFIATYEAISAYYVEKSTHHNASLQRPVGNFSLIDGVTFITKNRYVIHNFDTRGAKPVRLGVKEQYFRFSLSFSADGKGWAIHHFVSGRDDRLPEVDPTRYLVSRDASKTLTSLDEGTYFISPFRF